MDPRDAQQRLERLRNFRLRKQRDLSIGPAFDAQAEQLKRLRKRVGPLAQAWESACPTDLIERTAIGGLSRGILTINVDDHATKFELDRALRAGAEREFIRLAPMSVRRLKLVVRTHDAD